MDRKKIGRFIAACRKSQKLTQFQLAEQLGVSDRAISKWETGNSLPDNELALALCHALNINISDLFAGERLGNDCCYGRNSNALCCGQKG